MPLYDFVCECGQDSTTARPMSADTTSKYCPNCGEPMRRVFSVPGVPPRFEEHFNHSVGKVVRSQKEFKEDLKRASDKATRETGIPHNFVPTEIKPVEGPGTESQAKRHRELGTPGFERKKNYF